MNNQTFYTRQMLSRYSRQLVAARRLARYDQMLGRGARVSDDAVEAKRNAMIERVAREIMENLIFSGSDNPIVQEIKSKLEEEARAQYVFRYPPADQDFKIFRINAEGEEIELSQVEKQRVMGHLWDVALRTVDATML